MFNVSTFTSLLLHRLEYLSNIQISLKQIPEESKRVGKSFIRNIFRRMLVSIRSFMEER